MESRDYNSVSQTTLGASFWPRNFNFKCITPTCQPYPPTRSWGTITPTRTPTPTSPQTLICGFDIPVPIPTPGPCVEDGRTPTVGLATNTPERHSFTHLLWYFVRMNFIFLQRLILIVVHDIRIATALSWIWIGKLPDLPDLSSCILYLITVSLDSNWICLHLGFHVLGIRFSSIPVAWNQHHWQLGIYTPKCYRFYWLGFEELWTDGCVVLVFFLSLYDQWQHFLFITYIVSTPYSYSCKRFAKDAEDQLGAPMGASHSLKSVHGTVFKVWDLLSSVSFVSFVNGVILRLGIYVRCYILGCNAAMPTSSPRLWLPSLPSIGVVSRVIIHVLIAIYDGPSHLRIWFPHCDEIYWFVIEVSLQISAELTNL